MWPDFTEHSDLLQTQVVFQQTVDIKVQTTATKETYFDYRA